MVIWLVEMVEVTRARHGADIRSLFATKQLNTSPRSGIALKQNRNASFMQAARSSGVSATEFELKLMAIKTPKSTAILNGVTIALSLNHSSH